jgi:hypothetical protein
MHSSCSREDKWICILQCGSDDCAYLDEEKCECVTDYECINEKWLTCLEEECICSQEAGGAWCSYLTNDSKKTWKLASMIDQIRRDTITYDNFILDYFKFMKYTIQVDHRLYNEDPNSGPIAKDYHTWFFDDPLNPARIILYGPGSTDPQEWIIVKLTSDTLQFYDDGNWNTSDKELLFVPE